MRTGRVPGVYRSWPECQAHVNGFPGAVFKSFTSASSAQAFCHTARGGQPSRSVAAYAQPQDKACSAGRTVWVYFDGGSRGNPGPAGSGAAVFEDDPALGHAEQLQSGRACLGHQTNNCAEYEALILGLLLALQSKATTVHVRGDSSLVINQVNKVWQTKHQRMAELCGVAQRLLSRFDMWDAKHVYRESNTVADQLANDAMDDAALGRLDVMLPSVKAREVLDWVL